MKNQKGISLITLLITIIVMLVIASIATYNGINSINLARETSAKDELKAICSAILKNGEALDFTESDTIILTAADFASLELPKYYNEEQVVRVEKKPIYGTPIDASYQGTLDDYEQVYDLTFDPSTFDYELSLEDSKTKKKDTLILS